MRAPLNISKTGHRPLQAKPTSYAGSVHSLANELHRILASDPSSFLEGFASINDTQKTTLAALGLKILPNITNVSSNDRDDILSQLGKMR